MKKTKIGMLISISLVANLVAPISFAEEQEVNTQLNIELPLPIDDGNLIADEGSEKSKDTSARNTELDIMGKSLIDQGTMESGYWTLDSDGKLYIEGVIYPSDANKWKQYEGDIKSIEIGHADLIGNYYNFFSVYTNVESIVMGETYLNNITNMSRMFFGLKKLKFVSFGSAEARYKSTNVTSMVSMFNGCTALQEVNLEMIDTSSVTDMNKMFSLCSSLTELDLSGFNTSSVRYMQDMFYGCSGLINLDLSAFDTSSVMYMSDMFNGCSSLKKLDLSSFNTCSAIITSSIFRDCGNLSLLSLSKDFKFLGGEFLPELVEGDAWLDKNNGQLFSSSSEMNSYHNNANETNTYQKVSVVRLTMDAMGGEFEGFEGSDWLCQELIAGGFWAEMIPTKENYQFAGWYIDQEYTEKFDFNEPANKSLTIYAKWIESYIVTIPAKVNLNSEDKLTVSGTNNGSKTLKINFKKEDSQIDDSFKLKLTHEQSGEVSAYSQLSWEQYPSNVWNILTIAPESESVSKSAEIDFSKPGGSQAGKYKGQIVFSVDYE